MGEAKARSQFGFGQFIGWALSIVAALGWVGVLSGWVDLATLVFLICLTGLGIVLIQKRDGKLIGITLACVAVSLLAVFLSATLPHHGEYRFTHETAAVKGIQTIHTAQAQYRSKYGRFATSLAELGPPVSAAPTAAAADLIGNDLASREKSGYKFILAGNPSRLHNQRQPRELRPSSGTRTFYSDQTMVVHENYGPEPATANSKALK